MSRRQRHGRIPAGYGLGFVGLAAFGVGGVADMVWHLIFGVEVDLEALLSPTHLLLFVSGVLIVSSPLRAAMSDPDDDVSLPVLLSTTILTAMVAFFFMEFSPFITDAMRDEPYRFAAGLEQGGGWLADELQLEGLAAVLVTTVILIGPTLMLLRRWRVPMGSLTLLFGTVSVLVSSLWGFEMGRDRARRRDRRVRRRRARPAPAGKDVDRGRAAGGRLRRPGRPVAGLLRPAGDVLQRGLVSRAGVGHHRDVRPGRPGPGPADDRSSRRFHRQVGEAQPSLDLPEQR